MPRTEFPKHGPIPRPGKKHSISLPRMFLELSEDVDDPDLQDLLAISRRKDAAQGADKGADVWTDEYYETKYYKNTPLKHVASPSSLYQFRKLLEAGIVVHLDAAARWVPVREWETEQFSFVRRAHQEIKSLRASLRRRFTRRTTSVSDNIF